MVLIGNNVTLLTLDMCLGKSLVLGEGLLAIAHTMTLEVRFCCQVDTILVAEVIPTWIVGIVTSTNGVDIQILHNLDILNHALNGNNVSTIGIEFMTVGTLDKDRLTVDQQLTALDLYVTETHLLTDSLQQLTTLTELNL